MTIEEIIFYVLLIDSIGANLVIWFGAKWYTTNLGIFTRFFPPAKGWSTYYLILILFIGWILYTNGMLTLISG